MYTWHVTFASHPEVSELAARVQTPLAALPGLDLIPGRWLHLTMQGIGFTDEVPEADIALIAEGARKRQIRLWGGARLSASFRVPAGLPGRAWRSGSPT